MVCYYLRNDLISDSCIERVSTNDLFGSLNKAIAWALGMVSLGAISLGSFQTGAILLAGLFCYDIFWVFGTDVMMTVATKGEHSVISRFMLIFT